MKATISDIIDLLEDIAPSRLAEDWDNVGLQLGKRDWPVRSIWIALDPLPEVVAAACREKVDLIITHHPLIFRPINNLDFDTPLGAILKMATENNMGILSAHTNLDTASDGINDVLASRIGLKNVKVFGNEILEERCSLAVTVPPAKEESVSDALFKALSAVEPSHPSTGNPASIGKTSFSVKLIGSEREEERIRIEAAVRKKDIGNLMGAIRNIPSSDTFDYRVNPLMPVHSGLGLGRLGELEEPLDFNSFAALVKKRLGVPHAKAAGSMDLVISKAAVCSGSGSGLVGHFFSSDAQAYISGDLRYHDARDAEAYGRGLIDIGHFASEQIILEVLSEQLSVRSAQAGLDVTIEACGLERDPFMII